jgi:hypothetical protein
MENQTQRQHLIKLALESYRQLAHSRTYALTPEGTNTLATLAAAIVQKRAAEDRTNSSEPTLRDEIGALIQKLADTGCNLLQRRPSDPPLTPKPWRDPVTDATLPNPFAKNAPDLKGQTILTQRDPALAKHLKAMAEDPYATIAKLQDEEAERQSLAAIPYDEKIHQLNPFLGNNATALAEFVKRDPMLAAFYREEAKPVEIPLFGAQRNLTVEGKLFRDAQAAAVLKLARVISRQWLDADKQAAIEARAQAQKELERLQQQIA